MIIVNMALERHTVWYSEYNKFSPVLFFSIFLYVVCILQYVSAVKGRRQVSYIHSFYINPTLLILLLLLHWPMFTLMEVEGVHFGVYFQQ
jgi:hypothetical protein